MGFFDSIGDFLGDIISFVADPIADLIQPSAQALQPLTAAAFAALPPGTGVGFEGVKLTVPGAPGFAPGGVDVFALGNILSSALLQSQQQFSSALLQSFDVLASALRAPAIAPVLEFAQVLPVLSRLGGDLGSLTSLFSAFLTGSAGPGANALIDLAAQISKVGIPGLNRGASAIEKILAAIIKGEAIDPVSVLGALREILLVFSNTAGKGGAQWIAILDTFIRRTIPELSKNRRRLIDEALVGPEGFEFAAPAEAATAEANVGAIFPLLLKLLPIIVTVAIGVYGKDIREGLGAIFPRLEGDILDAGAEFGELLMSGMNLLQRPMRTVVEAGSGLFFRDLLDAMDRVGHTSPDNVEAIAPYFIGEAASLGMTAHLASVVAEKVSFFKNLGFPQLAAFLVDMAGFSGISRNLIGQHFEAALRTPSRRRALRTFRPELPGAGQVDQMRLERLLSLEETSDFYAQLGWTDDMIARHLSALWREPNLRELGLVYEDVDADPAWVYRMLQQQGYSDEDADILMRSVRARAQKTGRAGVVSAASAALQEGLIDVAGFADYMTAVRMRPDTMQYYLASASLKRNKDDATEIRSVLIDSAVLGSIAVEDLRAELATLGYDIRAQDQAARVVNMKRGITSFREEAAETKALIRRVQAEQISAAEDLHRRFVIDDEELRELLFAYGVKGEELDALVWHADIRRRPVPRLESVLSPEALLQQELELQQELVLARLRGEKLTALEAVAMLVALGLEPIEASLRVGIIAAGRKEPSRPPPSAVESAAVREIREAKTQAALEAFRNGLSTSVALQRALVSAGHAPAAARAIVELEQGRAAAAAAKAATRAAARELQEEAAALEDAAVAAFKRGDLDEEGLFEWLLALGKPPATAEAIVMRESARKPAPKP